MKKAYLGIDIGSISTKAVIIDDENQILGSDYLWTQGAPIDAVQSLLGNLKKAVFAGDCRIAAVGTTGSARRLIGAITAAAIVKNEITAHAVGTLALYPDVRTIFEIGGQDSKIILLENGVVLDYAMNTICAAGTGAFLSSQAHRLGVAVEEFGRLALQSEHPTSIAARCTVFAESDLVHKAQIGHKREDIIAGLCRSVVNNYLNNVAKGKKIRPPIVFQGGVSKNAGVIRAFEQITGHSIQVDPNSSVMGALGAAILARKSGSEQDFDFSLDSFEFATGGVDCQKCPNHCEIVCVYRDRDLIDFWGNRCERGRPPIVESGTR